MGIVDSETVFLDETSKRSGHHLPKDGNPSPTGTPDQPSRLGKSQENCSKKSTVVKMTTAESC